jgi:hypothetical protein
MFLAEKVSGEDERDAVIDEARFFSFFFPKQRLPKILSGNPLFL